VTSPEDLLERCALADILTEVAIMDDVTTLFVQAAAASVKSPTNVTAQLQPTGISIGDDLPSARAQRQQLWAGASRQQSSNSDNSSRSTLYAGDGCPTVCLLDFGITTGATWLVQVGSYVLSAAISILS
jgi:hypothetical protein